MNAHKHGVPVSVAQRHAPRQRDKHIPAAGHGRAIPLRSKQPLHPHRHIQVEGFFRNPLTWEPAEIVTAMARIEHHSVETIQCPRRRDIPPAYHKAKQQAKKTQCDHLETGTIPGRSLKIIFSTKNCVISPVPNAIPSRMPRNLPLLAAETLRGARPRISRSQSLVGLDGFVDTILHVVAKRESATKYSRTEKMALLADKIREAAGFSANIEMVTQMLKLGGNGPIMANALASFSSPVTYVGNLGFPHIHPVFETFAKTARVISIAEPGYTDAVEFHDGKLMLGKHESLKDVTWKQLVKMTGEAELLEIFSKSSLVALVNWTMLPHLTDIFRKILTRIAPKLEGAERWAFFDLADPAKRSGEDIAEVLRTIARFEKYFRVILGLNFNESRQIGSVLGIKPPKETHDAVAAHAAAIRSKLGIDTVVIHPTHFAAAADASGSAAVAGPFTPKPKITTGAGDHFNAGFCLGRLLHCDLEQSLQMGVGTSGYYVRNARSPRLEDLRKFLQTLG